jgi:hypothetical protein
MPGETGNPPPQANPSQSVTPPVPLPFGAPPPKSGPSALKIILIIVCVFVGLGMIGAGVIGYGVWRIAHSVHKSANGDVTISTSEGTLTANGTEKFTESDLGIPIYPGAAQGEGGVRMKIAGRTMVTANYLTADPKDKVLAFYKDKAGANAENIMTDTGGVITLTKDSDSITVTVQQSPDENHGKTQITIVRAAKS